MSKLFLEATDKTPLVELDHEAGSLMIRGASVHENAARFFDTIQDEVDRYARSPLARTKVTVFITYFNSSSAKYLLDILKRLDDLHASGASRVDLEWVYDQGDQDMAEVGNDYRGLLDMPVKVRERREGET